jgi:AmmeMemoRadiSam system protein B
VTNRAQNARPPAAAGSFYPAGRHALLDALRASFAGAIVPPPDAAPPKAVIVPHAGYMYSGPVAASAYQRVAPARASIHRVVLIGPGHFVPLRGAAVPSAGAFTTPLGSVPIDEAGRDLALGLPAVVVDDAAHAREHSLEVQLPFLQMVLDGFEVVPLVVGRCPALEVAAILDGLWDGAQTLIVASTDLSHYHAYLEAQARDRRTAAAIVAGAPGAISDDSACGAAAVRGLLVAAGTRHLAIEQLDLRSSGDTAGDRERVVGYGAFAVG